MKEEKKGEKKRNKTGEGEFSKVEIDPEKVKKVAEEYRKGLASDAKAERERPLPQINWRERMIQ